ncbi:MAG: hypothetical protein CXZ00_04705 [Acidobacteria bacterium]|nr:MAG: hypothetical protein CXZ00_04705 [Acidobacteriota bacterium]
MSRLTNDEQATVLAALTLFRDVWFEDGEQHYNRADLAEREQFEHSQATPLTPSQIDDLCKRIKAGSRYAEG